MRDDLTPVQNTGHPLRDYAAGLGRTVHGPFDFGGAVMSTLGSVPDALIAKPGGELAAKIPAYRVEGGKGTAHLVRRDPREVADEARGAINTAMGSARAGGTLDKMPDFGPGFAPLPSKIRAPAEPRAGGQAGPVYGAEPKRAERLDNALHRVRGNETADKLKALKSREAVRKAMGGNDQAEGENLTQELEQALVNPKRKLSDRAQKALAPVQKVKDAQTADVNAIRRLAAKHGLPIEEYAPDQGYVPRMREGALEPNNGLVDHRDPISGRGLALNRTTSTLMSRANWRMLEPKGEGEPIWVDAREVDANPGRYELGSTVKGSFGRPYRVRQPTIAEIEQHTAGTDHETRYHKNYYDLMHSAWVRTRQVRRNLEVLDAALTDLRGQGLAHRVEWMRPETTARGTTVYVPTRGRPAPDGFVQLPHIPQLKGYAFAPEIAEVFKDYKPGPQESAAQVLSKINGTLTSSIFWNPLPHTWNVANDWAKARGWDWLPGRGGYASLVRNGTRAVRAVVTKDELYQQLLREGASLMSGDRTVRNFHELMLQKGIKQLGQDKTALSTLMHAFDLKGLAPQKLIGAIYKAAGNELWNASDILMVQRIIELQGRGLPVRDAIAQAEKDIASYRAPSRVMGSRAVSELVRSPNALLFGRYHYGMLKSWGTMFRDLYAGKPAERTEAAGKLIAALILAHGVYPMMDAMVQHVTGDKDARMHRGGGMGLADAGAQLVRGQREWMAAVSRLLDLSQVMRAAGEASTGRDAFGRAIINPPLIPAERLAPLAEHLAGYVSPLGEAEGMLQPGGARRALARNLLVEEQTDRQKQGQRIAEQRDRRAAARLRRTDPLMRLLGD